MERVEGKGSEHGRTPKDCQYLLFLAALEAERADLRSRYGELQRAAEAAEQRLRAVQAERETMQRTLKEEAEKAAAAEAELQQLAQQKVCANKRNAHRSLLHIPALAVPV